MHFSVVPTGLVLASRHTQGLRPFDFAQGRLWANVCRPFGAAVVVLHAAGSWTTTKD